MAENARLTDPDIVEMDFPPYVEEYSPFPDVEPEFNFEDNKEEIYLRNRIIAAQEQVKLLKEEERKKLEKQEKFREMTEAAKAADRAVMTVNKKHIRKTKISVFWTVTVVLIAVCWTAALISFTLETQPQSNISTHFDPDTSEIEVVIGDLVIRGGGAEEEFTEAAATQVSKEPAVTEISEVITVITEQEEVSEEITEINDEILKTTAVREPLDEDGSSYIYNTAAMSYKFTPMYTENQNQYGQPFLSIYVTVKNLTDYNYAIVPNFIIDNNGDITRASVNESSSSQRWSYAEQLVDGEWVATDTEFIAYDFDENHLCSFRLQFYYSETSGVFSFAPSSRISREYAEKSDKDFQIPLEEILKYI